MSISDPDAVFAALDRAAVAADVPAEAALLDRLAALIPADNEDTTQATHDTRELVRLVLSWGIACGVHPDNVVPGAAHEFDLVVPW